MTILEETKRMKEASPELAGTTAEVRNEALRRIRKTLTDHQEEIFQANKKDLERAEETGLRPAIKKRLLFDEKKLASVSEGISDLIRMKDPIGEILLDRELDSGLRLRRVRVPIGVIGVIFEARPDALVQISTLCLKSGNCAILKGGKETAETNRVLFTLIHEAASEAGLPEDCLFQAEAHSEIDELLQCDGTVDLLIPRGSNAFVRYIMDHTRIPVMGHADGVCHTYADREADLSMACSLILDGKAQYPAACNATETVLIDRPIVRDLLPRLSETFRDAGIHVRGDKEVLPLLEEYGFLLTDPEDPGAPYDPLMKEEEFHTEYLDLIASVKLVDGVQEAVRHINAFGSHHTDAIVTKNEKTASYFQSMVDSAGVYWNASTRFADGYRYGFGAEVGISTAKLHARGPVGLEGLTTYKYCLSGAGQTVREYADGEKQFHFHDLL